MSVTLPRLALSDDISLRALTVLNEALEQIETQEAGQDELVAALQVAVQAILDAQAAADQAQADADAAAADAATAQTTADGKQPASDVLTFLATATAATAAAVKTLLALVKADVGLDQVDNTSDANKPVSTAQATAIGLKADKAGDTFSGPVILSGGVRLGAYTANADAPVVGYVTVMDSTGAARKLAVIA